MLISKTGNPDYPKHLKALVMGPPKSGKTSLLATFPNVIIADVEGGLMSIAHKNVPYVNVDSSQKLDQLKIILSNDQLRANAAASLDLPKIETVAVDTTDALQELLKQERMASEQRTTFQREDWSWLLETMTGIIKGFVNLPLHVVFTVHVTSTFDDESRMIYAPALQGSIQDKIAGMVGFSLFADRSVEVNPASGDHYTRYTLLTEGDAKNPYLGNRAAGRLPRRIDPSFDVIFDAVYQNLQLAQSKEAEVSTSIATDTGSAQAVPAETPEAPDLGVAEPESPTPTPVSAEVSAEAGTEVQGEPESQEVGSNPEPPEPTGTPDIRNDEDDPITANAVSFLQTAYRELDLELPSDVNGWTLGKGRAVASWILACKEDWQTGQDDEETFRKEILRGLEGMNALGTAPEGTVEEIIDQSIPVVQKWVGESKARAQEAFDAERAKGSKGRSTLRLWLADRLGIVDETIDETRDPDKDLPGKPKQPDPDPEPNAEEASETTEYTQESGSHPFDRVPDDAEDVRTADPLAEAEERLKSELGATEIRDNDAPDKPMPFDNDGACEECGGEIDDPDIAILAQTRLSKRLCVDDYMRLK